MIAVVLVICWSVLLLIRVQVPPTTLGSGEKRSEVAKWFTAFSIFLADHPLPDSQTVSQFAEIVSKTDPQVKHLDRRLLEKMSWGDKVTTLSWSEIPSNAKLIVFRGTEWTMVLCKDGTIRLEK